MDKFRKVCLMKGMVRNKRERIGRWHLTPSIPASKRGLLAWGGLYINGAHMQKIGRKFQKLSEILRFENLATLRFRLNYRHKNSCKSLNF